MSGAKNVIWPEVARSQKIKKDRDDLLNICKKILKYREGKGEYNFSTLSETERSYATMDAWDELEMELRNIIKQADIE